MYNIIHGANPENLYRAFNVPMPERVIDFSTNVNVLAWPKVNINLEKLASSYPDPECRKLTKIISEREGISRDRILFTNGINQAIFLLARLFDNDVAILQPNYSEYKRAFKNTHDIFTLDEINEFKHIIITNPNNPTGKFIKLAEVISSSPDKIFIIDEAYIDFLRELEPERLCDFDNVIILRSLTKIFHLSGVRIGYIIANEKIISDLKDFLPSWSVNAIAQELAVNFLENEKFYDETRNFYRENTPEFMNAIRDLGFDVMNSDVHYFLIKAANDIDMIKFLLMSGIVVRHTRNFIGLQRDEFSTIKYPVNDVNDLQSGNFNIRENLVCGVKSDRLRGGWVGADGRTGYIRVATRLPEENKIFLEALRLCAE
ncbi:MAG: aminotransferase class I/II-fold pyridoxal phosphate-dependent enzyme [Synergistaceae bacterium]|nr:aminotransferase class I/II-fold pyridoxal phosphate-dependent enzyme [Synergistaceae bacterium]